MYPFGVPTLTSISVAEISERMEGAARPTHFSGVATVVAKLFAIAGTCAAYFGEKDWQQLAVVRRMAADLSFPVDVVGCPTVREPDGLALSSRNAYLTPEERAAAPVIHRCADRAAPPSIAAEASAIAGRGAGRDRWRRGSPPSPLPSSTTRRWSTRRPCWPSTRSPASCAYLRQPGSVVPD